MVWDPGIEEDGDSTADLHFFSNLLKMKYPDVRTKVASMRAGSIILNGNEAIKLKRVILDSGALHSSYLSKNWVDRYRPDLKHHIRKVKGTVTLGDNETAIEVSERVSLKVDFVDWQGAGHSGIVDFCVFSMPGLEAIVGLPDILKSYLELFITMLQRAKDELNKESDSIVYTLVEKYSDLVCPWSKPYDGECEEEAQSYVPCSFTGPLCYLSYSHEEAVQKYLAELESHVAKDWQENTDIIAFLQSDIALDVFVPKTWKGIGRIEPVEFEWDPNTPKEHKPHCRPINPKLYEAT